MTHEEIESTDASTTPTHSHGDGKWIDGLTPDMPVADAASLALQARFHVVRHYLPLAVHNADDDSEHVHRLRVGTRRANAALRIFEGALPGKALKKGRRCLRGIRRAAGEARNWDVFLIDLMGRTERASARDRPGFDFLIGHATAQRALAQDHLTGAEQKNADRLEKSVQHLIDKSHKPEGQDHIRSLRDLARKLLPECLQEVEQAAERNLDDYEHLHRVRILGKQLRYAMEVVACCFPPEFRETTYRQVETMQDILGNANDSHVAVERLSVLRDRTRKLWPAEWKRLQSGVNSLLRFHRLRLPREQKQFLVWWKNWKAVESGKLQIMLTGLGV